MCLGTKIKVVFIWRSYIKSFILSSQILVYSKIMDIFALIID